MQRSPPLVLRVFGRGTSSSQAIRHSAPPQQVRTLQSLCPNPGFNHRPALSSTPHFGAPRIQAVSHRPDPKRKRQQRFLADTSLKYLVHYAGNLRAATSPKLFFCGELAGEAHRVPEKRISERKGEFLWPQAVPGPSWPKPHPALKRVEPGFSDIARPGSQPP